MSITRPTLIRAALAALSAATLVALSACANYSQPATTATTPAASTIKGLADLKGKVLAVQTDTTGQKYAEDHKAEFGYEIKVFDDLPGSVNAVLAGSADAAINDNGVLYDFAKENPTTKVVAEFATDEHYGINVAKDNTALMAVINEVIATAKSDGSYNDIYKKWFGVDAPN